MTLSRLRLPSTTRRLHSTPALDQLPGKRKTKRARIRGTLTFAAAVEIEAEEEEELGVVVVVAVGTFVVDEEGEEVVDLG